MSKLRNPLLSLGAVGRLTKDIVFTRRRRVNIIEKKPEVPDAKTLTQLSWRHMYQKAVALWHALSALEKQEWESLARPKHMTGFAWFMSQALKPNPGLYLPLQGGTMQGDIDMASHNIFTLPDPTNPQDAATKAYIDAHKAALAPHLAETLPGLLAGGNLLHIPTNAGWTEIVVDTGVTAQETFRCYVKTGINANSSAYLGTALFGFRIGTAYSKIDWDKKLYLVFNYTRLNTDTEAVARCQIKEVWAEGALAAKGLGIRIDGYALKGESYGTALGVVDLGIAPASDVGVQIAIIHYPGSKIEWYVDGVLKGTQSTANNIPSGQAVGLSYTALSIINGATGGADAYFVLMHPKIWQEL